MPEKIFVSDLMGAKMPQKPYYKYEKIQFWGKNGLNLKLRHRKALKIILSGKIMVTHTYRRPGDWCCI